MNSNIKFTSNVYPIHDSIISDKKYLSKIFSRGKLRYLNQKYFTAESERIWTPEQQKILNEPAECSMDKSHDPCWGMIESDGKMTWKCKCINTECVRFKICRPDFDLKELEYFSPKAKPSCWDEDEKCTKKPDILHNVNHSECTVDITNIEESIKDTVTESEQAKQKTPDEAPKNTSTIGNLDVDSQKAKEKNQGSTSQDAACPETSVAEVNILTSNIEKSGMENDYVSPQVATCPRISVTDWNSVFHECSQNDIITSNPDELMFVDAGPGSGKTYALIKKIIYMVTEQDINAENIMVLCFTNSAVDEIKKRLNQYIRDNEERRLINVDIRTFHSFARWLIRVCNDNFTESGWKKCLVPNNSFDLQISVADYAVKQFGKEIFENWKHFIVDEVQDLTNELASFVLDITGNCIESQCGITVLGDYCQSIYGYTTKSVEKPVDSEYFYKSLADKFGNSAKYLTLNENHRQEENEIELLQPLRDSIKKNDREKIQNAISLIVENTKKTEKSAYNYDFVHELQNNGIKNICILLRNNGDVQKVSSDLYKRGIDHITNNDDNNINYSSWIADIFANYDKDKITYDEFKKRFATIESCQSLQCDEVWKCICKVCKTDETFIVVSSFLKRLATYLPDDKLLRDGKNSAITVSTIHRAKGREFDQVILDNTFVKGLINCSEIEEFRLMYVAATRVKKLLMFGNLTESNFVSHKTIYASSRKRWLRWKKKKVIFFEFNDNWDLSPLGFAQTDQTLLLGIKTGDAIELVRESDGETIFYNIKHKATDRIISRTEPAFWCDLRDYMSIDENDFSKIPSYVDDLYVKGVYSQIVDLDSADQNDILKKTPPNGIWKWVDISGLGHCHYEGY